MFTVDEQSTNAMGGTELQKLGLEKRLDPALFSKVQITASRIRELDPNLKQILWCHDLSQDPEMEKLSNHLFRSQFNKIVFVSNWQQQMYNLLRGVTYAESAVVRNSIMPSNVNLQEKVRNARDGTIRLIYHTTPHRGLHLLYPIFEQLCQDHDDIYLDVYSSFSLYGWEQRDEPYKELFDQLRKHPSVTYHGAVPNEEVLEALKKAHIFAYPSIWQETSCISLLEAMSAGCFCVHPNFGALPETASNMTIMYDMHEDHNIHASRAHAALDMIIEHIRGDAGNASIINYLDTQKAIIDSQFSWDTNIRYWENIIKEVTENE